MIDARSERAEPTTNAAQLVARHLKTAEELSEIVDAYRAAAPALEVWCKNVEKIVTESAPLAPDPATK